MSTWCHHTFVWLMQQLWQVHAPHSSTAAAQDDDGRMLPSTFVIDLMLHRLSEIHPQKNVGRTQQALLRDHDLRWFR